MIKHSRIENATNNLGRVLIAAAAVTLASGLAVAGVPGAAARSPRTEKTAMNDIESLKRAENTWAESLKTGDVTRLATIIDDKFTFIGPDGEVEKRDAYLGGYAAMAKMGVVVERIDMDEVEFRVLGEVGIVTGRVLARVKMQGAPMQENVRFTRVYRRGATGWQMVTGQGTRIAPQAAPPPKG